MIEKGHPDDAAEIRRVNVEVWLATYPNAELGITRESVLARLEGEHGEKIPEKIARWRETLSSMDNRHTVYVAKHDGRIVGYTTPRITDDNQHRIGSIYVLPELYGTGIGTELLDHNLAWHGDENDIYLNVADYNTRAIRFYSKAGFTETGRQALQGNIPTIEMIRHAHVPTSHRPT